MPTSRTPLRATVKDIDPNFFSLVCIQFMSMFRLTDLTIFSRVALHKFPKMAETPKCHFFVRIDVGCQLVGPPLQTTVTDIVPTIAYTGSHTHSKQIRSHGFPHGGGPASPVGPKSASARKKLKIFEKNFFETCL